ncbi:unnamed protein product [Orchesella dallaii]|uniref:Uncharacterized protein n=1 Tax=Orchesella dallaii TaxID=48710 RepID=A0ABP1Q160_9HEXA
MPLNRCTCRMDQPSGCRVHREFDVTTLEILARGRVSPDLLQSPTKRHVSSPSNQQVSSFTFEYNKSPPKGQALKNMVTTYQTDFCRNNRVGGAVNIPIQNGK